MTADSPTVGSAHPTLPVDEMPTLYIGKLLVFELYLGEEKGRLGGIFVSLERSTAGCLTLGVGC